MKALHKLQLAAVVLMVAGAASALADDAAEAPRLTVELRDGSRVVGQSVEEKMKFHSALLGDLKFPVASIRNVEFTATKAARLTAANGDVLAVQLEEKEIPVRTSFGKVELAVDSVRKLEVSQFVNMGKIFSADGSKANPPFHVAYVVPAGTVGNQELPAEQTQTVGTDFDVNTPVQIVALGVFDSGGDGLICKLHVRIYDRDNRLSIADAEFTPEEPGILVGGSRFLTLPKPITLSGGFHGTLGVAYLGQDRLEPLGNWRCSSGNWTLDGNDGAISFVGLPRTSTMGSGDVFPEMQYSSPMPENNFAAGTFIFKRLSDSR